MIWQSNSYEGRRYATRRTHLMPLRPVEVVRKATLSDWLSGFFCVAVIAIFITLWGIS